MYTKRFPELVSSPVVRTTAAQVFILSLLALLLRSPWLALILVADFALRSLIFPRISPLAFVSRNLIVPAFQLKGRAISYAPKRFAALIGLGLSGLGFIFGLSGLIIPFYACFTVLGFFSFLEAALDFCAGCKIYVLLMSWGIIPPDSCPDCHL
jgi:hypothetical protein